jgi:hypothetical protein
MNASDIDLRWLCFIDRPSPFAFLYLLQFVADASGALNIARLGRIPSHRSAPCLASATVSATMIHTLPRVGRLTGDLAAS